MTNSQRAGAFDEEHVVTVDGATVAYRTVGEGPALVLLHGFPLSSLTWRKVVPALSRACTCWAFDLIGFGGSRSADPTHFSSEGQGRLIQRALAALGVSHYALIGNDTGGWVAREVALLDPSRVTHLALTNTEIPGHRPPWIPLYQRLAALPGSSTVFGWMLASRLLRRSSLGFGGCFADLDLLDGEFSDCFIAPVLASAERRAALARFLVEMKFARLDRFRELHGVLSMPVAFFWGAADPTFPEAAARTMVSQFPNVVGFRSIPKGKLYVQEEYPDRVATLTLELLRGRA